MRPFRKPSKIKPLRKPARFMCTLPCSLVSGEPNFELAHCFLAPVWG